MKKFVSDLSLLFRKLQAWQWLLISVSIVVAIFGLFNLGRIAYYYTIPLDQLSSMGTRARQSGNSRAALDIYHTVSARASHIDFSSNYELGNIYLEAGKWRTAEHYYLKAAANPAALQSVFYQLMDLYLNHLTDRQGVFADLLIRRLQSDRRQDEGLMIVLGSLYRARGEIDKATPWFKQALAIDPNNQSAIAALADMASSDNTQK